MSDYAWIVVDRPLGGVQRITLNRPEKRNPLSNALRGELFDALLAGSAMGGVFALGAASIADLFGRSHFAANYTAVDAAPAHAHLRLSTTTSRAGGSAKDELRALRGAARALGHALVRRIHLMT